MFQFSGFATGLRIFNTKGCPIRTLADQKSFAPPRKFSQLTTSFVASGSQGIPHAPLFRFHFFPGRIAQNRTYSFGVRQPGKPGADILRLALFLGSMCTLFQHALLTTLYPSLVNELFATLTANCGSFQANELETRNLRMVFCKNRGLEPHPGLSRNRPERRTSFYHTPFWGGKGETSFHASQTF